MTRRSGCWNQASGWRTASRAPQVRKVRKTEQNSWIELTIFEGRTHQVKRMLEAVGHPVLKLKRIRFGPLSLGSLQAGEFRFLRDDEIHRLKAAAFGSPDASRTRRQRSIHAS